MEAVFRSQIETWRRWLALGHGDEIAGPITDAVMRLLSDRERWRMLTGWIASNPLVPAAQETIGWFWYDHAVHTAVRLRRLADEDGRSASLGQLLVALSKVANGVTRRRYRACWRLTVVASGNWSTLHADLSNDAFDTLAGANATELGAAVVGADLERLRTAIAPVKLFVDKRIAHHNPDHDPALTPAELDAAIDVVVELFQRYCLLLNLADPPTQPPTDNTRWGEAFTTAWRVTDSGHTTAERE